MTECVLITEKTEELFKALIPDRSVTWVLDKKDMILIGGIRDNKAVAVMVCGIIEDHIKIMYICVDESYRRKRVAADMVEYICIFASQNGYLVSADYACRHPAHDPIPGVFDTLGYFAREKLEGYECILPMESIKAFLGRYENKKYGYKYFEYDSIPKEAFNELLIDLSQDGLLLYDTKSDRIIDKFSQAALDKDGSIVALIVVEYQKNESNKIKISFAYCDKSSTPALISLLLSLAKKCELLGDYIKEIKIEAVNKESASLIERIIPDRIITKEYYRSTWNLQFI